MARHVVERRCAGAGAQAEYRARDLSGRRIGHTDDRDLLDGWMGGEQVLDLARADVLG